MNSSSPTPTAGSWQLDTDFPGGNGIVERVEGNEAWVRQDLRDTTTDWFFWAFRVRGAQNRSLTLHFLASDVVAALGPALSTDGGQSWSWLGQETTTRDGSGQVSITWAPGPEQNEVILAMCPLYTREHWDEFLRRQEEHHRAVECGILTRTRKGAEVPQLLCGTPDAPVALLLTARHHACESMASYALEGLLEAALAPDELGKWFQRQVRLAAVPFMDLDGVQAGDQGKNRAPFDHNRDYGGPVEECLYPEVSALRQFSPGFLDKALNLSIDFHCPWIRDDLNEDVYFVGVPGQAIWQRVQDFSTVLERERQGPLPYRAAHNLAHGVGWNVGESSGVGKVPCARWMAALPGIHLATSLEVPYALAGGAEVNPGSARRLGTDLARALRAYLIPLLEGP